MPKVVHKAAVPTLSNKESVVDREDPKETVNNNSKQPDNSAKQSSNNVTDPSDTVKTNNNEDHEDENTNKTAKTAICLTTGPCVHNHTRGSEQG